MGKTEWVFDGDWLSRNAFRERESICGLMMTSCKNYSLKEREKGDIWWKDLKKKKKVMKDFFKWDTEKKLYVGLFNF